MGCDIHMWAEVQNDDGTWSKAGDVFTNHWHEFYAARGEENMPGFAVKPKIDHPHTDRNYPLFSVLAGVRGTLRPIDEPRGIPDDVSHEILIRYSHLVVPDDEYDAEKEEEESEAAYDAGIYRQARIPQKTADCHSASRGYEWFCGNTMLGGLDWHSASWLTVQELLEYDWDHLAPYEDTVTVPEYRRYLKKDFGFYPSDLLSGTTRTEVTLEELARYAKAGQDTIDQGGEAVAPVCTLILEKPVRDFIGRDSHWFRHAVPELKALHPDPDRVRIVFWFDN